MSALHVRVTKALHFRESWLFDVDCCAADEFDWSVTCFKRNIHVGGTAKTANAAIAKATIVMEHHDVPDALIRAVINEGIGDANDYAPHLFPETLIITEDNK